MASADKIRNRIIDKLLAVSNPEFLKALDLLISSKTETDKKVELTPAQKRMLLLSEEDIAKGNLISQEEIDKEDLKWLEEL
ncbi:hypothetical protein [Halocola ammonii]